MDLPTTWIISGLIPTIIYLFYCSITDLQDRTISKKLSLFFMGWGLVNAILVSNTFGFPIIILWLVEMLVISFPSFWLLKKGFGGGDFWMVVTIQSLNPILPIPFISLLIHGIAGITAFIYRKKWNSKDKTIPFAPYYFAAYLAVSILVGTILFLL